MRAGTTHDYRREALGAGREIRAFDAVAPGRYQVEGVGPKIVVGDRLRFTLKGSQTLDLVLTVQSVEHKLIPIGGWRAQLTGQDFSSLDIHRWSVRCDGCGAEAPIEFAVSHGASQAACVEAAQARAEHLGWQQIDAAHHCPACAKEATR